MKIIELITYINNEKQAEEFLRSRGILKTFTRCHNCASDKLGMIRGNKWKCYSCKSEWTRRKNSLLSQFRMKYSEFLLCLKFFELELTAEKTSQQLNLNYRTIQFLFNEFRKYLTSFNFDKVDANQILKGDNDLVYLVEDKNIINLKLNPEEHLQSAIVKIKRHFLQEGSAYFDLRISALNGIESLKISKQNITLFKFFRFARKRLFDFKGTGKRGLLLRLKEIEYRFNNPNRDIFKIVLLKISKNFKGG